MPVIGCCNSPPNLVVITQFVPIGSLYQVLHEDGGGGGGGGSVVVDTPRALQFASDIAKGMAFLHSLDRQMPRFHLNSKHVMVSLGSYYEVRRFSALAYRQPTSYFLYQKAYIDETTNGKRLLTKKAILLQNALSPQQIHFMATISWLENSSEKIFHT